MAHPPHIQRVLDERAELDERRDKLTAFAITDLYRSLPNEDRQLLMEQANLMGQYSRVLTTRLQRAGVV